MARPIRNLQDQRFGRWLVLERVGIRHGVIWRCRCDCGTERNLLSNNLVIGNTLSCGCLRREVIRQRNLTHGESAGGHLTAEYRAWQSIRRRCFDPRHPDYHNYGGRGILMCDEWRNCYQAFLAHVGRRPSPKHSIDRINNELGYQPGNMRWATSIEQIVNRRATKLTPEKVRDIRQALAHGERTKDVARRYGVHPVLIYKIAHGERWAHVA